MEKYIKKFKILVKKEQNCQIQKSNRVKNTIQTDDYDDDDDYENGSQTMTNNGKCP